LRQFHRAVRVFHKLLQRAKSTHILRIPSHVESYIEESKRTKNYSKLLRKYLELRILFEENEEEDDDDDDEEDEEGFDGTDIEKFKGPSTKRSPEEIASKKDKVGDSKVTIEADNGQNINSNENEEN
jgi:hypothetical protein